MHDDTSAAKAILPVLAASIALAGCSGGIFGLACTTEMRSNLFVEVRDADGRPAALGATGSAAHEGGGVTELASFGDSLRLNGQWTRERAGDYRIAVRKPGHATVTTDVRVEEDACHVETRTVRVDLARSPASVAVAPIDFVTGAHGGGMTASAGVQVVGDTLVIVGSAHASCSELEAVAYRAGDEVHVQLQPAGWDTSCGPVIQQFRVRYPLPQGWTYLQVTNGYGMPAMLFDAPVAP